MKVFDPVKTNLNGTLLIEASAGTGKTYSLMHVILRIIVEKNVPLERILVVTFTKNATYELKARLRAKLKEVYRILQSLEPIEKTSDPTLDKQIDTWIKGNPDVDRFVLANRVKTALDQIDDASVFTIHSFCQKMLQQYAFSSKSAFEQEHSECENLFAKAIDEVVRSEAKKITDDKTRMQFLQSKKFDSYLSYLARRSGEPLRPDQIKFVIDPKKAANPAEMAQAFTNFCVEAPKKLKNLKAQNQVYTFDDILVQMDDNLRKSKASGEKISLAQNISKDFAAVLIDEFQDTDTIQYSIFKSIFLDNPVEGRPVIFVGDPKQSIYGFRSAEIECYLAARNDMADTAELTDNYRSTPGLVEAANVFFNSKSFLNNELSYTEINSLAKNLPLFEKMPDGTLKPVTPFEMWVEPENERLEAGRFHALEDWAVAEDIAKMLSGRFYIYSHGELRELRNSDIAILVRKRKEADGLIKELGKRHIRCQIDDRGNVLETEEAAEIMRILKAMENVKSSQLLNAARSTRIFGEKLSSILKDDNAKLEARLTIEQANKTFAKRGILAVFTEIFNKFNIEERLLKQSVGERTLTNYQHILDLLYKQSRQIKTISGLIRWMQENKVEEDKEDSNLRRESDADVVKIETVHKSKGLEYPVVYLMRSGAGRKARYLERIKDGDGYIFSCEYSMENKQNDLLDVEESVRLTYVAFTRASARLVIPMFYNRADDPSDGKYLPSTKYDTLKGPIWRILTPDPSLNQLEKHLVLFNDLPGRLQAEAVNQSVQNKLREGLSGKPFADQVSIGEDFKAGKLVFDYNSTSDLTKRTTVKIKKADDLQTSEPAPRKVDWIQTSFTGLTKNLPWTKEAPALDEGNDEDIEELQQPVEEDLLSKRLPGVAANTYGDFLHKLLERTDFSLARDMQGNRDKILKLVKDELLRLSIEKKNSPNLSEHAEAITDMLGHVLQTEGIKALPGFRLCDLEKDARAPEMDFLITTGKPKKGRTALTGKDLGAMLAKFDKSYQGLDLSDAELTGYLTGSIDLAFFAEGKYWIIDWKSNLVAPNPADYTEEALDETMQHKHYTLQYLLYTVALKRFLEVRLGAANGYDLIGGIAYFFLRGVNKDHPGRGVYFRQPSKQVIDCLDDVLKNGYSSAVVEHYLKQAGGSNG